MESGEVEGFVDGCEVLGETFPVVGSGWGALLGFFPRTLLGLPLRFGPLYHKS